MPTAPRLERQVVDAPLPNVRVTAAPTAETYGAGIGDIVTHAGVRFYDLETRAANHTAVFSADRQLADTQSALEQQMYQTKGRNVLGAHEQWQATFDKAYTDLESGLANDQQRGEFQQRYQLRRQQFNDMAQKYIRQEYSTFQDAESNATMDSVNDRIRQQPDNPLVVAGERQRAFNALSAWAQRKGLIGRITPEMLKDPEFQRSYLAKGQEPPTVEGPFVTEAYKEKRQVVDSRLHREVIEGLLAKDQDQSAADYLAKNRQSFTAGDLDAVEKHVEEGSTRGESRRQAQALIATHGMETADQRRDLMKAIEGIKHDKVADLVKQRVEHEFSVYDKRKEEDYTRQFMVASKVVETQGLARPRAGVRDLVPVPLWNSLKPEAQHALELHLKRLRTPADTVHEPKAWFELNEFTAKQIATMPPDKFMGYLNRFDEQHYDRAIALRNAAQNSLEKSDDKTLSALSNPERIRNAWKNSGIVDNSIPVSKWTAEQDTWYHRFESEADKALSMLPKDAKPEEIQKVLTELSDRLLQQKYKVDPGLFRFNKDVPAIGMQDIKGARSIRIPLKDIPAARQEALKGALKAAGMAVTNQNIEELEAKARLRKQGLP